MPTPHINAKKGDIAKTVLMPGDPLRAKFIAEEFLENIKLVNSIRGMLGYTGTYKGKEVSVMASGMGMPSIGIYSTELFSEYEVDNIIRVGSCGSYNEDIDIYEVILATSAYSETTFDDVSGGENIDVVNSSEELNKKIESSAKNLNINLHKGCVHTTDVFYKEKNNFEDVVEKYNCLAVEMESFALFYIANKFNKNATALLTVSDSLVTKKQTSSEEREKNFVDMIKIALESI